MPPYREIQYRLGGGYDPLAADKPVCTPVSQHHRAHLLSLIHILELYPVLRSYLEEHGLLPEYFESTQELASAIIGQVQSECAYTPVSYTHLRLDPEKLPESLSGFML